MKLAIHHTKGTFSDDWIKYCESSKIPYKIVNCYSNNIVNEVSDCDALLWHFSHNNAKDYLFAKQLLLSLAASGKKVFPDFNTMWHFDDKAAQKYLLEAIQAQMVPTYVFYNKPEALKWAEGTKFPKVFKLRKGAGSQNVRLAKSKKEAVTLINKAFGKGFSQYEALSNLKERWRKYKLGKTNITDVIKGIIRIGYTTEFDKIAGKEKGYIYFQDFIPNNNFDIRVIVIDKKAFAIKRMVRENDFRASGSGNILFEKKHFDDETIRISFELNKKLNSQCLVIDYVFDNGKPLIVELSYGFTKEPYYNCPGYWDENLNWHEGPFNSQHWMIDQIIKQIN
ncbi:MAG: hypothetical protein JSS63_13360 [Bacteroidetes bacterium]|nr:hypothetical protein [Bacteroidota bacterium]